MTGLIRINWRPPLDTRVYGYGSRIDPGGYIHQIFDGEGRKLVGGSSSDDLPATIAHAKRLAADRGLPDATVEVVSTAPLVHYELTLEERRAWIGGYICASDFHARPTLLCRTGDGHAVGTRFAVKVTCPTCREKLKLN